MNSMKDGETLELQLNALMDDLDTEIETLVTLVTQLPKASKTSAGATVVAVLGVPRRLHRMRTRFDELLKLVDEVCEVNPAPDRRLVGPGVQQLVARTRK